MMMIVMTGELNQPQMSNSTTAEMASSVSFLVE
jgi:hypothetical protein